MLKQPESNLAPRKVLLWMAAVFVLGLAFVAGCVWIFLSYFELTAEKAPWQTITAVAAVPALILIWYWRKTDKDRDIQNEQERNFADKERNRIEKERLVNERHVKALELIANESSATIRLGGVLSLERVANDFFRFRNLEAYREIIETLCAFVRERSPAQAEESKVSDISADIQTALTVLGRTKRAIQEGVKIEIDLHKTCLNGANFGNGLFQRTNFSNSSFVNASMICTNLESAILLSANLKGAHLDGAKLFDTVLMNTNLAGAKLKETDLEHALLDNAAYDDETELPNSFDPQKHQMKKV